MAQHEFYKSMYGAIWSGKGTYRHTDAAVSTDFAPVRETSFCVKGPALDPAVHFFFPFDGDRF